MPLLKQILVPFLVCLALASAGCAAWRLGKGSSYQFSHQQHQKVKKCASCHPGASKGEEAGMPALKTCMICHKSIDSSEPPERQVGSLFEDGHYQAAKVTALSDEIIFSHESHTVDHDLACADCHQGIMERKTITSADRVGKQDCLACHAERGKTEQTVAGVDNCALCHSEIDKDTVPPSHAQNWERFHGQQARDGDHEGGNQCSLCHTEESCNSCHQTQAPSNHTNFWREQGHGVAVSMDRDECATCHQSDFCASCHKTTAPRTHRGQWSGTKSTHCLHCHIPVSGENCATCHQDGTPSHAQAAPNPHGPDALNCRSCHTGGQGAPMPHVDNGDDCNYCHQ